MEDEFMGGGTRQTTNGERPGRMAGQTAPVHAALPYDLRPTAAYYQAFETQQACPQRYNRRMI